MRIGLSEIILIVVLILAFVRPDKLKDYSHTFSEAIHTMRKSKDEATAELINPLKDDVNSIKDDIDTMTAPLQDAVQPIKELNETIQDGVL